MLYEYMFQGKTTTKHKNPLVQSLSTVDRDRGKKRHRTGKLLAVRCMSVAGLGSIYRYIYVCTHIRIIYV